MLGNFKRSFPRKIPRQQSRFRSTRAGRTPFATCLLNLRVYHLLRLPLIVYVLYMQGRLNTV